MLRNLEILSSFTEKLAYFLSNGSSLNDVINNLQNNIKDRKFKSSLNNLSVLLKKENLLGKALEEESTIYPSHICKIIKLGEEKGKLAETLKKISKYLKDEKIIIKNIKDEYLIPFTVKLILFPLLFIYLSIFVLPSIINLCSNTIELPVLTRFFMFFAGFFSNPLICLLCLGGILSFVIYIFLGNPLEAKLLRYIPIASRKLRYYYTFHLAWTGAMLMEEGLSEKETFSELALGVKAEPANKSLNYIVKELTKGLKFSTIFEQKDIFPGIFCWLTIQGHEQKDLPRFFKSIVKIYHEDSPPVESTDYREYGGTITVITLCILFFILSSVLLPIYKILDQLN